MHIHVQENLRRFLRVDCVHKHKTCIFDFFVHKLNEHPVEYAYPVFWYVAALDRGKRLRLCSGGSSPAEGLQVTGAGTGNPYIAVSTKLEVLFFGVLVVRDLLLGVYIRVADFWKLPYSQKTA